MADEDTRPPETRIVFQPDLYVGLPDEPPFNMSPEIMREFNRSLTESMAIPEGMYARENTTGDMITLDTIMEAMKKIPDHLHHRPQIISNPRAYGESWLKSALDSQYDDVRRDLQRRDMIKTKRDWFEKDDMKKLLFSGGELPETLFLRVLHAICQNLNQHIESSITRGGVYHLILIMEMLITSEDLSPTQEKAHEMLASIWIEEPTFPELPTTDVRDISVDQARQMRLASLMRAVHTYLDTVRSMDHSLAETSARIRYFREEVMAQLQHYYLAEIPCGDMLFCQHIRSVVRWEDYCLAAEICSHCGEDAENSSRGLVCLRCDEVTA